jgi:hypothetical protein
VELLWSQQVAVPLRGLAPARERGWVLSWDMQDGLHLWDRQGNLQAHGRPPAAVASAAASADGRHFVVLSQDGRLWLLAPDLSLRWEHGAPGRGGAVALAPQGERVAAAIGSTLYLLDSNGKGLWAVPTPRPLRHLVFVPERPLLVGCADFGFIGCFDAAGQLQWRDAPVAHIGSLATNSDGSCIVLACFSDGVCAYAVGRNQPQRLAGEAICHLADISYTGDSLLMAGVENRVFLRPQEGTFRGQFAADGPVIGIALGPLGDYVVVATAGLVSALAPHGERREAPDVATGGSPVGA